MVSGGRGHRRVRGGPIAVRDPESQGRCYVRNNRPADYYGLKLSERLRAELGGPRARAERAAARGLLAAVYGADHPYAHAGEIDPDSYMRIDNGDANGFRKDHYVGRRATLLVTGTFAPPPLAHGGGALGLVGAVGDSLPVVLAWAVEADDGRFAARLVAARMLERRMRAVREQQGASYGALVKVEPLAAGVVYRATAHVDAARAGAAIRLMREQAATLARGERLEADFVQARSDVIEELLGHSTSSLDRAAELDWLGARPPGQIAALIRSVATLRPAELAPVLAADLAPERQAGARLVETR
jgi:predicted Zn-dependent peptidase